MIQHNHFSEEATTFSVSFLCVMNKILRNTGSYWARKSGTKKKISICKQRNLRLFVTFLFFFSYFHHHQRLLCDIHTCHFQSFSDVRNQEIGFYRRYSSSLHWKLPHRWWFGFKSKVLPGNFKSNDESKLMSCLCYVHPFSAVSSLLYHWKNDEVVESRRNNIS